MKNELYPIAFGLVAGIILTLGMVWTSKDPLDHIVCIRNETEKTIGYSLYKKHRDEPVSWTGPALYKGSIESATWLCWDQVGHIAILEDNKN